MKAIQRTLIAPALAATLLGIGLQAQAQTQSGSAANPASTTTQQEAQRGVPGVDVDLNRRDGKGVPGVDVSAGAEGDQRNVNTRVSGAGAGTASGGAMASDTAGQTRTMRADRN